MKKYLALFLAAAMAVSTMAVPAKAEEIDTSAYEALDEVELIGADSTGKGAAGQIFGEYVASRVEELTGGKLTIDYHPNGDLGGDADLIRQMQSNDIQIVVCQTAPTVSFIPENAVFDLPMVFAKYDGDKIDAVLNGDSETHKALDAAYEANGLHPLGFLQNATYRLTTSNTDLPDLAAFKGLKIRTMENANHMTFWSAIGAEPTPLAWGEVYISLQNGTIAAEENAADTVAGANLHEVQKYLAFTNHILYCNQIAINKDKWESLDPAYQQALVDCFKEATAEMRVQLKDIDASKKKELEEKGMTMIPYENAFYDEILALPGVQDLYKEIDGKVGGLGTTLQEELAK